MSLFLVCVGERAPMVVVRNASGLKCSQSAAYGWLTCLLCAKSGDLLFCCNAIYFSTAQGKMHMQKVGTLAHGYTVRMERERERGRERGGWWWNKDRG